MKRPEGALYILYAFLAPALVAFAAAMYWYASIPPVFPLNTPSISTSTAPISAPRILIGEKTIHVAIVDTPTSRTKGLSGREKLRENEGMLFIFEKVGTPGFWMKDMNFSIDIIWMNETFEIVDIDERVEPSTYPAVFKPQSPILYVLETSAGFVKAAGVKIGDVARLER